MTAKEYLGQIRVLDAKIDNMQRQLDDLREMITATGGIDYTRERVDSSPEQDQLAARMARYIDMGNKIDKEIDRLIDMKYRIVKQINLLKDDRYIILLDLRYVRLLSWEQISSIMGYSLRHVYEIHGEALSAFNRTIDL